MCIPGRILAATSAFLSMVSMNGGLDTFVGEARMSRDGLGNGWIRH
jgi:hypothetical protein